MVSERELQLGGRCGGRPEGGRARGDRGARLERHGGQPDAHGAGHLGARDPARHRGGDRQRLRGRRPGARHHRGVRRLQPARHYGHLRGRSGLRDSTGRQD